MVANFEDNGFSHGRDQRKFELCCRFEVPYFPDYKSHSIISHTTNSDRQSLGFKTNPQLDQETPACDSSYILRMHMPVSLLILQNIPKVSRISIASRTPFFGCKVSCKRVRLTIRDIR